MRINQTTLKMNNRNSIDSRNFVYALLSGLRLAFYLAVLALILGTIFFVQCEKPKANLRVPYNPLYKNTECKDLAEDSTMTQGKIETLNEILAR